MPRIQRPSPYQVAIEPQPEGWRWQIVANRTIHARGTAPSQRLAGVDSAIVAQMFAVLDRASARRF